MDYIWLKGIECRSRIGVTESERRKPQKLLLDIRLALDLRKAGETDDLRDTVDYWAVYRRARETAQRGEFRLAEHLAETLARETLREEPRLRSILVAVHKKPAAMPKVAEVVVEILRERG